MEKRTIITILLIGLVLLSGVQTLEIIGLKGSITGTLSPSDSGSSSAQGDQQQTRYSQASASPQMVGGC